MIPRHKTAMGRAHLSRPIQLGLGSGLIDRDVMLLDYGCGHGGDLRTLSSSGYDCLGWAPVYRPDGEPHDWLDHTLDVPKQWITDTVFGPASEKAGERQLVS